MQKKLFSAEIRQFSQGGLMEMPNGGFSTSQFDEIMEALRSLQGNVQPIIAQDPGPDRATDKGFELGQLKQELQQLSDVILETRREIASLQSPSAGQKLNSMTDQLDEVVKDTENATNSILEAVEIIADKNESLELNTSSPEEAECTEAISRSVMKIYEACNFQDVTGQRISKVVSTLTFIDERIASMIDILGGKDELVGLQTVEQKTRFDGEVELNGPQAEYQKISQDEIDSLFD